MDKKTVATIMKMVKKGHVDEALHLAIGSAEKTAAPFGALYDRLLQTVIDFQADSVPYLLKKTPRRARNNPKFLLESDGYKLRYHGPSSINTVWFEITIEIDVKSYHLADFYIEGLTYSRSSTPEQDYHEGNPYKTKIRGIDLSAFTPQNYALLFKNEILDRV